ncbi:MAG: winged helix-turn-helix transcriptional regulator, partial [Lactococcus sp.]|nr:winged helix-turn-helix transcriptional regulator [Lactococcus sp.]
LSRDFPDVSRKTLTLQLRQLEADGLIVRMTTSGYPLKVEYHLTPDGLSMIPVLDMICDWGNDHISPDLLAAKLCD